MADWQTKSSKVVYENPWMIVHEDQVIRPDGKDGLYGFVESKCPGVYVVPVDDEGNTYLVQQHRYTLGALTWETIAGRTDNEDPEFAGRRELMEETGLEAKDFTLLATTRPANGISRFLEYVFIATGITKVSDKIDTEEGLTQVKRLPLDDAITMIRDGEIQCSDSIAALYMARDYLAQKGKLHE